jgi:hypothetical protein
MGFNRLSGSAVVLAVSFSTSAIAQQTSISVAPVTPAGAPIGAPAAREPSTDKDSMQPVGAHFGSFTFFPKLEGAVSYDDNIYALGTKTDDVVGRLSPSMALKGQLDPYTLNFLASLDRLEYGHNKSESRTDWSTSTNGGFEFAPGSKILLNAGYGKGHEDRGDPNALTTNVKPTKLSTTSAGFEIKRELARLKAGIKGSFQRYNYDDALQIGGGITNNDDRDRDDYAVEGRVGYEFSPGYSVIARLGYDKIHYDDRLDDGGYARSSKGLKASAGVAFELTRIVTGEATVGYIWRKYKDARFPDVKRFGYNASIEWFVTDLTSLRFIADRGGQETVAPGYLAYIADTFSIRVEHELMRTVKLTATARFINNDYLRNNIVAVPTKSEKYYGGSLGVRYDLNRNFYALLGYDFNKKTSNATTPGSAFTRNKLALTLGSQF